MKIQVSNISKTLDDLPTLDRISLTVERGQFVVILGPSGCGKSTLLNIISGLLAPDQGRVILDGEDWTGRTGKISYMQQKDLILPFKNILENLMIPLLIRGENKKEARTRVFPYLNEFGLKGFQDYYPYQLSGGMRQRAALLRTYLFKQDALLLDEPFAALDAINRRKMQLWLKKLCQTYSPSVLLVTHDIEEALLLADDIFVFSARPAAVKLKVHIQALMSLEEREAIKKEILSILEVEADK